MKRTAARFGAFAAAALLLAFSAGAAAPPDRPERRAFAPEGTPLRYMPARRYDLQHLRLDLAFDGDARSVSGTPPTSWFLSSPGSIPWSSTPRISTSGRCGSTAPSGRSASIRRPKP